MRNQDQWQPSKYVIKSGKLQASSDSNQVSIPARVSINPTASVLEYALKTYASGRLLDLGCGKVPLYQTYRSLVTDVVCADWSNSIHGGAYWDLICDLNTPLPFAEGYFDTVLLTSVLEHIANPQDLLHEVYRLLKPGGRLIANVPFLYSLHEVPWDYYRYTRYGLSHLSNNSGFHVEYLVETGGVVDVVTLLTLQSTYRRSLSPLFSIAYSVISPIIENRFVRMWQTQSTPRYPLGYVLVAQRQGL
ncbi:MAG: class I SAM-dependent methyltransferase [Caldilineaceae bacterium]|nr:class I SAM-dependent methyltransferase [Caldilineaceae bacterium]